MATIPTYSAAGRRLGNRRLAIIEQLLADGLVTVERNRKGTITCAQYRFRVRKPEEVRIPTGHSFQETLPSGHRAWKFASEALSEELSAEKDQKDAERFVQAVFRAVPLSILAGRPAKPVVVPIRSVQKTSAPHRPIEFDSQMRAA